MVTYYRAVAGRAFRAAWRVVWPVGRGTLIMGPIAALIFAVLASLILPPTTDVPLRAVLTVGAGVLGFLLTLLVVFLWKIPRAQYEMWSEHQWLISVADRQLTHVQDLLQVIAVTAEFRLQSSSSRLYCIDFRFRFHNWSVFDVEIVGIPSGDMRWAGRPYPIQDVALSPQDGMLVNSTGECAVDFRVFLDPDADVIRRVDPERPPADDNFRIFPLIFDFSAVEFSVRLREPVRHEPVRKTFPYCWWSVPTESEARLGPLEGLVG